MRVLRSLAVAAPLALTPAAAAAAPQTTVGFTAGAALRGEAASPSEPVFTLGARADLLLGRTAESSFGVGPYLDLQTLAFDDLEGGGGVSLLLPVIDSFPLVVSGGGYATTDATGGVAASLFWGSRNYNFHSWYGQTYGVQLQYHHGLGDPADHALLLTAQIDAAALYLPVTYLVNAISGPSSEAAPLR